ncbi:tetratricopeptide repeat protein [Blastomonas fulva]|uniref:tetratricopeptide repeat protein n=1 Tax=Blastomonas fulva TaxID=1550728 RepID=UPI0025A49140|nr:tetratricopeptide repeat protein [Blastomonas fulva]MDM7928180.1 tetratricopeptide repeat protein [Blastomonas fulva]MDM7965106.1 tetratricopeptide repeat protein [Blastomonas fulva]
MHFAVRRHRSKYLAVFLATTALITAAPLQSAPIDASKLDDAALAAALGEARGRSKPLLCDELVPLTAEALKRAAAPANAETFAAGNAALWCAIEEKRYADASAAIELTEAKLGRQEAFDRVAISLDSFLSRPEQAIARIDILAKTGGGEALTSIPPEVIYDLSRAATTAKRPDLKLALWSSIYSARSFGQLDPEVIGGTGINLLQAKADSGLLSDKDSDLADLVTNAGAYAALLSQRRYAPLWPHLEERAGDNLAEVLKLDVQINAERFKAAPNDTERFAGLIYSLLQSGNLKPAIDATEPFREDGMDYSEINEQIAWAINSMAIALRASGRPEEGLKALDALASLDPEQHSWVVNFAINHAAALAGEARHAEALASYDRAQPIAEKQGSPFARAIITGQRACSLHTLGRTDEAAAMLKALEAVRLDAVQGSIGSAMCVGRDDLAIAWALEALADDTHRPVAIAALQPRYMENTPPAWNDPEPNLLLAKSPELAAAFEKVARVVPERFAPLGGKPRLGPKPASSQP